MKLLLFIYCFFEIFCWNIEVWENTPEYIEEIKDAIFTGATNLFGTDNYIYSYKISKKSYIKHSKSNDKIEVNDIIRPISYFLNVNNFYIYFIFTENNNIYRIYDTILKQLPLDKSGIKSLKGIIANNLNELIVSLIGTNTIIILTNENNEIKQNFYEKEIINMDRVIKDRIEYYNLLYKKNNNYTIDIYTYSFYEKKLIYTSSFDLDIELYKITEIYLPKYNNNKIKLYLFSYNKNEKLFNFYYFEYTENKYVLKQFGNKYNFLPFRNAEIIEAFFLPFADYLYYLIKIENEKYAGVFDIINNIIIYNFKTTTEFISYQSYFIIYSEKNTLYKVCPFGTKEIINCDPFFPYPRLIKISKNGNYLININNKCSSNEFLLEKLYCYEKCPSGYNYNSQSLCDKCTLYDLDNQICTESCKKEQIYDELNGVCYSCKPFKQYKNSELNICVDDCSPYNLFKDENNNICYTCKDIGKYLQDGKCEDKCGPAHHTLEDQKVCIKCEGETKYFENDKCVKDCSKYYTKDENRNECILCNIREPYLQDGECVKECNQFYKINHRNKTCINCQDNINETFLQNNECVEKCDKNYKIDYVNKVCINCKENENKKFYLQDNECVEKCDNNYKIDDINKICINCKNDTKETPYYQDNDCVRTCNSNYKIDTNKSICINCQKESPNTPYLQDNDCVDKCNDYYIKDNEKMICYKCDKELYFFNETCVEECPEYYIKDEKNKRCYKCEEENSNLNYYENGTCVQNCSKYYYKDEEKKICIKCNEKGENLYFQDNQCVQKCKDNYVVDNKTMVCYNCSLENPNSKPYFMNNKCVKECSPEYAIDNINKTCYKCKDKVRVAPFVENGLCVRKCSEKLVSDNINYMCLNCTIINNTFYQDNKCVEKCSPGYIDNSIPYNKYCINCFRDMGRFEYNGDCVNNCPSYPEYTVNNPKINKCQTCKEFNEEKIFYEKENKTCVSECPIGTEKDKSDYTCKKCINYYNNMTKKCVDKCPNGCVINDRVCEKCNLLDKINNECVSECAKDAYPFFIKEDNYSICFEGFCGYGEINKKNYKNEQKDVKINNLYSCNCLNKYTFGKLCQYQIFDKKSNNDIVKIEPLQEIIYTNKTNIFYFEFKNKNSNIKSLRYLEIDHNQYLKRRLDYIIEWKLIQNNCKKINNQNITSNDYYFIIEPGTFIDDCDKTIQLKISDKNKKIIAISNLGIKTKSLKSQNFNLILSKNEILFNSLNKKPSFQIILNESILINENYIYKYYYITDDEEEFSLTNYMKNNKNAQDYILPYCSYIKVKIKNDFYDIIEISSEFIKFTVYEYKNLSLILNNFKINNNEQYDHQFIWEILTDIKSYFSLFKNNYNEKKISISEVKRDLETIINIIKTYLPSSIKNENNTIKNNNLEENEDIIETNVFISLLNQISLFLYYNINDDNNYKFEIYKNITNIIYKSLIHNNKNIDSLYEKTILSYLRTIDNLLLIMNQQNDTKMICNEIYNTINILKNILTNNMISGTSLRINGSNNFDIYLIKPGYYSEEFSILNDKTKLTKNKNNFTLYNNYKIQIDIINNNTNNYVSDSLFSISKNNYDYLYDELTYLKNKKVTDLIISIIRFNYNNLFLQKLYKIINYNNNDLSPKILASFKIEIEDPINKKIVNNLNKFIY